MQHWTASDIPEQTGRTAVVTGTGGLGFQGAMELARAGARVIIAGRNPLKGAAAVEMIRQRVPGASIHFESVDLADLNSIETFGNRILESHHCIDLLINNAAVMAPPQRQLTVDGHELQFGTNHLGHYALTAHLMPLLRRGRQPRVVSVSSVAARQASIDFDDLQSARHYKPMAAYGQSKLACLMFAFELQRLSDVRGWGLQSIASHPGISRTDLLPNGMGASSPQALIRRFLWFLFQPVTQGALPALFAATAPQAKGGLYYGPDRLSETRGHPTAARIPLAALDRQDASRLWAESARLVGVHF